MSKDMDEKLKLAHKVVEVVDRANRKIYVTLLRYDVKKPESFYAQVRLFARKKEDENFQQVVHVNYKLEEFIYLLDVVNSVYDNFLLVNLFVKFKNKFFYLFTLHQFSFFSSQDGLEIWR